MMFKFKAFTLVELLVIVAILSIISTIAVNQFFNKGNSDLLLKQNKVLVKNFQKAILGSKAEALHVNGFFHDMGKFPRNIRELLENPESLRLDMTKYREDLVIQLIRGKINLEGLLELGSQVLRNKYNIMDKSDIYFEKVLGSYTGIKQKWQGPYLPRLSEEGGAEIDDPRLTGDPDYSKPDTSKLKNIFYRDAFKNKSEDLLEDAFNFGWKFELVKEEDDDLSLSIESYGYDPTADEPNIEEGEEDYFKISIAKDDYLVPLNPWVIRRINFKNLSSETFPPRRVKVGLYYLGMIDNERKVVDSDSNEIISLKELTENSIYNSVSDNSFYIPEIKPNEEISLVLPIYFGKKEDGNKYIPQVKELAIFLYDLDQEYKRLTVDEKKELVEENKDSAVGKILQEIEPIIVRNVIRANNLPSELNFVFKDNVISPKNYSLFDFKDEVENKTIKLRKNFFSHYRFKNEVTNAVSELFEPTEKNIIEYDFDSNFFNDLDNILLEGGYLDEDGKFVPQKTIAQFKYRDLEISDNGIVTGINQPIITDHTGRTPLQVGKVYFFFSQRNLDDADEAIRVQYRFVEDNPTNYGTDLPIWSEDVSAKLLSNNATFNNFPTTENNSKAIVFSNQERASIEIDIADGDKGKYLQIRYTNYRSATSEVSESEYIYHESYEIEK